MNQQIHIHIHLPQPQTEGDRIARSAQNMARAMGRMLQNKIDYEQRRGNPLWAGVETFEQYQAALAAEERQRALQEANRRRELGFWRYHFGNNP